MNDLEKTEIRQNKAIRGYIIRCLVKGYNNTALTRQLSNAMIAAGLIISPDISKYLDYLQGAGYIEFTEETPVIREWMAGCRISTTQVL